MTSFPKWVPAEVIVLYEALRNGEFVEALYPRDYEILENRAEWHERYYASHEFRIGLQALGFAIESKEMEKAWRAIERRRSKANPDRFAFLILSLPGEVERFIESANKENVNAWSELAEDLKAAARKFIDSTGEPISQGLSDEIFEIKTIAGQLAMEYSELGTYVGQRSAESAPRLYVIRRIAETLERLYKSPLYDTVSATAALILDEEPLDSDHIRKNVVAHRNRPKPWWWESRPEEIQESD
jgi:hypothetical protein